MTNTLLSSSSSSDNNQNCSTVLTSVTEPLLRAALVCGPNRHAARCYKGYNQSRCWGPNIHLRKTLRFTKDVLPVRWGKAAQPRGREGVSTQEGKVQRLQRRCWSNLCPLRCPVSQLRALTRVLGSRGTMKGPSLSILLWFVGCQSSNTLSLIFLMENSAKLLGSFIHSFNKYLLRAYGVSALFLVLKKQH